MDEINNKNSSVEDYEKKLLDLIDKAENENHDYSHLTPQEILTSHFGYNGFKPNQLEIMNRILRKEGNTLGIMPTGGGKSLCFQIPALILPNLTVIISPLIALMKDQIDNLTKKKIYSSFFINSSISESTKEKIFDLVKRKKVKLLYIAPESLKSEKILNILSEAKIGLFVIDEAHCISTWGHDFRPDYLKLSEIIKKLNEPPILALTATATKEVEDDIQKQLGIKCKIFKSSFDRPLLYINVTPLADNVDKELFLFNLLKKLDGQTIIYVTLTETAEKLEDYLSKAGFKCTYYHGQIEDKQEKEKRQNQFISGECDIIISTIAFGMGIDKSDIRNIIHFNCSQSIENYYQEIGRSGRDGYKANCITLYSKYDIMRIKRLKEGDWPNEEKVQNVLSYLKNKSTDYIFTSPRMIQYECDIKEVPVRLILHRLEEFGAIKVYSRIPAQIQIIKPLSKNPSEIIKNSGEYSKDLGKIFACDYFRNSRKLWLVFEEIMQETKLNYFRIKEIFTFLEQNSFIKIIKETNKDLVIRNKKIDHFDISPLTALFQTILNKNLKKVGLLTECLLSGKCIRKEILAYFGENYEGNNCQMCSNCIKDELTSNIPHKINENYVHDDELDRAFGDLRLDAQNEDMKTTVLKCVLLERLAPKKDFSKILSGNLNKTHSKWKFGMRSYNILGVYKEKNDEIENCIESLIKEELIQERIDGTLRISKKGLDLIKLTGTVALSFL